MTAFSDSRQIVSAFLAARQDPHADGTALMAETFTFESPLMRVDDRNTYLQNHRGFQAVVLGVRMISELYGSNEATLLYDLETSTPAGVQRTAEYIRIEDGRVASVLIIFDSAPWRPLFEN